MLDINICEASEKEKFSCIIFDVDESVTLDTIRNRIRTETEELIKADYRFSVSGAPVSLAQEQNVLVSEAIKWEEGEPVIRYQWWDKEKQENITVETKDAQQPKNTVNYEEQGTPRKIMPEESSQRSAFSMLKSPTTCSIKGIKLYSENDIQTSTGKEKERRIFWNRRAKELCKKNLKKADLCQRIHDDWRSYKTDLMTKEVKTLNSSKSTIKKQTLRNNIARVEFAKQKIKDLKEELIKADKPVSELRKLRDELSSSRSELRKAQDAFRKTTKKLTADFPQAD